MPKPQQPNKRTRAPRKPSTDTPKPAKNTQATDESQPAAARVNESPVNESTSNEPKWLQAKPIELKPVDPQPMGTAAKPRLVKTKVTRAPEATKPAEAPNVAQASKPVEAPKPVEVPKPVAAKPPARRAPAPRKSAARVQSQSADYSAGATNAAQPPVEPPPPPPLPAPKAKPRVTSAKRAPVPAPKAAEPTPAIEAQTVEPIVTDTKPVGDIDTAPAAAPAAAPATTTPAAAPPPTTPAVTPATTTPAATPTATSAPIAAETPTATTPVSAPALAATPAATPTAAPSLAPQPVRGSGDRGGLRILMIASEAVPFAKTGGLADVAAALPVALGRLGHEVKLVLPRYRGVAVESAPIASINLLIGQDRLEADIYEAQLGPGARVWLVDAPSLYDRDGLYGTNNHDHPDNPRRFAFLTRAAFEAARTLGYAPDVVHAHDWQAGLAPVYLKTYYANDRLLGGVPCVFTIHNIAYTGTFDPSWMPNLDLGWELFRPESLEYWSRISFLKAGINFSTKITTVSPTYAREILTPEFAYGFEGILGARRGDLVGILNGIDADTWNPATDPHIPKTYDADDLSGKRADKLALLKAYSLPADEDAVNEPLIGMISRMVDQKGLDMIASIAHELPTLGARFIVLGTGEPRYEEMWRSLSNRHPDRVAAKIGFDEPLSHLVEAGADLFLMPSRFEPCGLNQMYSLRYGTLPLVRATGGLDDTVENYDPYTGRGNGFKFWEASGPALLSTLRWALRVYDHPDAWQRLQRVGMQIDFSWARSAAEYARLYTQVLAAGGRPTRVATAAPKPAP